MAKHYYNKLVRDKIPEHIESDNREYQIYSVRPSEAISVLRAKIREEVDELTTELDFGSIEKALSEVADIIEVAYALGRFLGAEDAAIDAIRYAKICKDGGFGNMIRLIWADDPEGSDQD